MTMLNTNNYFVRAYPLLAIFQVIFIDGEGAENFYNAFFLTLHSLTLFLGLPEVCKKDFEVNLLPIVKKILCSLL